MHLSTFQQVLVIDASRGGLQVTTFENKLQAVLDLLDDGAIAGEASYYGSPEHIEALDTVDRRLTDVRRRIFLEQNKSKQTEEQSHGTKGRKTENGAAG